ncbi:MAG: prepilin-type N-terminal cleavage/methylation domain-containing protein [Betaproteobacteria bacterium]
MHLPCSRNPIRDRGFTLIEVMVTVAIVGILAAIAYPNYTSFVQRGRIIEATTRLSDFRVKMEQWFQDNRTYLDAGGTKCGVAASVAAANDAFVVDCDSNGPTAASYSVTATGKATTITEGFIYSLTVDAAGVTRATDKVPAGWTAAKNCWTTRKDGTCG